jgi:hypothetical protein
LVERPGIVDGEFRRVVGESGRGCLDQPISGSTTATGDEIESVQEQLNKQFRVIDDDEETGGESTETAMDVGSDSRHTPDSDQDCSERVEPSARTQEPQ